MFKVSVQRHKQWDDNGRCWLMRHEMMDGEKKSKVSPARHGQGKKRL